MVYRRRLIDDELDALMPELPAIGVDGPKGVGKTATGLQRAATVLSLDDPVALSVVRADPARALGRPRPILVDEWQRAPEVWDHVRRAVDDGAPASSFLLTGSATPALGSTTHSGAGRIVSLRMRPMTLPERDLAEPTVSLASLLEGGRQKVQGDCSLTLADYAQEIEASGFPGIRSLSPRARRTQLDSYLVRALSRDLTDEQGVTVRRPDSLRAWVAAYATATAGARQSSPQPAASRSRIWRCHALSPRRWLRRTARAPRRLRCAAKRGSITCITQMTERSSARRPDLAARTWGRGESVND